MKKSHKILKIIGLILNYALCYWLFAWIYFNLAWSDYSIETSNKIFLFVAVILLAQLFFLIKFWKKLKLYFIPLVTVPLVLAGMLLYFNSREVEPFFSELASESTTEQEVYHSREDFDQSLELNLRDYFREEYADEALEVKVELLREGPTITGLANPKFYAWISILRDGALIETGVIKIAEVRVKEFQVVNYFPLEEIEAQPKILEPVFPAPVIERINEKMNLL